MNNPTIYKREILKELKALAQEFTTGLHALVLETKTPEEVE